MRPTKKKKINKQTKSQIWNQQMLKIIVLRFFSLCQSSKACYIVLINIFFILFDFPGGESGKESACQCRWCKRCGFNPWVGMIPWGRKQQPTLVLLPGEFHRQRNLVGYSPWGHKESDMTEWLTHFTHT